MLTAVVVELVGMLKGHLIQTIVIVDRGDHINVYNNISNTNLFYTSLFVIFLI